MELHKFLNVPPHNNKRRALLITSGGLGDTILKLPVLRLFKENEPDLIWDAMGYMDFLEIGRKRFYFDNVCSIDGPFIYQLLSNNTEPSPELPDFYRHYHTVLSYHLTDSELFQDRLKQYGVSKIIFKKYPPPEGFSGHVVDYLTRDYNERPFDPILYAPRVFLSDEDRKFAGKRTKALKEKGMPSILIHPGAGSKTKALDPRFVYQLCMRLRQKLGVKPVLGFGPADMWIYDCLKKAGLSKSDYIPITGISVVEYASVMETFDLYVGADSGISHLSAALRVPSLVLFGTTEQCIWRPLGENVTALNEPGFLFKEKSEKERSSVMMEKFMEKLTGLMEQL